MNYFELTIPEMYIFLPGRFVIKIVKSVSRTVLLAQYVFLILIITIILKMCTIESITLYALHLSCRFASYTTLPLLCLNVHFSIYFEKRKHGKFNDNQAIEIKNEIQEDKIENVNDVPGFQCEDISKLQSVGMIKNNTRDLQKTKAEENKKDPNEFQTGKSKVEIDTDSQSHNQEETLMNKTVEEEEQSIEKQNNKNNFYDESCEDSSSTNTLDENIIEESENENDDNIEYDGYLCFK